jgi:hypothetical protein
VRHGEGVLSEDGNNRDVREQRAPDIYPSFRHMAAAFIQIDRSRPVLPIRRPYRRKGMHPIELPLKKSRDRDAGTFSRATRRRRRIWFIYPARGNIRAMEVFHEWVVTHALR